MDHDPPGPSAERETVTGRRYVNTRVRGLAPWRPQKATRLLLEQVAEVLVEYEDHLPLTVRQVYYRLVGAYGYPKTEAASERLGEHLNRARRAGFIPWSAIRDDQVILHRAPGFAGVGDFWASVDDMARSYRRDRSTVGTVAVELWVEAGGMVPQMTRVADDYGVMVVSSGGFNGVGAKRDAAARIINRSEERTTTVLHVGDYDPSGCALIDSLAEDIGAFCADYGHPGIVEFRRVAVIPEQVTRFDLPTQPQKASDKRGSDMPQTVQAEALTPDQLATEVRTAIEAVVDREAIASLAAVEAEERVALMRRTAQLPDSGAGA